MCQTFTVLAILSKPSQRLKFAYFLVVKIKLITEKTELEHSFMTYPLF